MRLSFRPVGARYFWIATALIFSATMGSPSAWAQRTCELSSVLQQVVGGVRSTVGTAVTPSGNIVESRAAVAATTNSALQPLTDILQPVVDAIPPLTNPPPSVTDTLPPALDPLVPVASQTDGVADRVVDNLCNAVKGLGVQSGIAALTTNNLTGAILGRLDGLRGQGLAGGSWLLGSDANSDGKMSLGAAGKARPAPPPGTVGPLTVYAGGTLLGGNSSDLPNAAGFSYDGGSGMLGLEYSVSRNLILGIAGSFTAIDADLNTGGAVGADVIHGAAYLSYATRAWFIDALAAYGAIDLDLARPGTSETVRGSTSGGAWAAAARGGYLFDFGKVRAGPIAGLTYVHARIDGYTETGSDPSAMVVGGQTVDSLTGSAGLRFLAPFQTGGTLFVPYLNVTLEHHFGNDTAELTTGLVGSGGTQPPTVSFPTFGARDYGKIEGGLTIELAPEASVSVSGASTFARDDGHDYRVSAGLNYRF